MPNPLVDALQRALRGPRAEQKAPPTPRQLERKLYLYPDYIPPNIATNPDVYAAIRMGTLVSGPGATDMIYRAWHQDDSNSAVFACLSAIATAYPEAPAKVWRDQQQGQREELPAHPLKRLLDNPNPYLSSADMWHYTQWCKHLAGNAYWRKLRTGGPGTNVVELWPISPARLVPVTTRDDADRGVFISYYAYSFDPTKDPELVPPEDIVHFRLGVDDKDHRLGCSPLARLFREVAGDDEAHKWQTSMLQNGGTVGMLVQVPIDSNLTQDQAEELKARFEERFSGDNRGKVGVLMGGASAQPYGFSPEQMDMKALHRIPEERIAAALRVPAIIAGLGAGLDRSTYANFKEAREMFAEMTLLPLYGFDAAALNMQLTPEFTTDRSISVAFDVTDLRAFQEDEDAKWARLNQAVQTGWVRPNEAREDVGLPPDMEEGPTPQEIAQAAAQQPPSTTEQQGAVAAPGTKQWPGKIPSQHTVDKLPEVLQSLVELAEPGLTADLNTYFDGQRKRVKRGIVS